MSSAAGPFHRRFVHSHPMRARARELPLGVSQDERELERAYARRVLPPLLGLLALFVAVLVLLLVVTPGMGQALWPLFALCCLAVGALVLWALQERRPAH